MNLHPAVCRWISQTEAGGRRMMYSNTLEPSPPGNGVAHGPSALSQPAILVVDDDPTFCAIMAEILRMYRARVYTAFSAEEAMAVLEQVTPDLILTDVMMPEVDGLTFVRRIRSGAVQARIPIIIVSAGVTHREQAAAMQAGADQFLPKPFSIVDLRAAVGSLLPN
jgi:CheY-like chemotaxis protein